MDLLETLKLTSICEIERISPPEVKSKHVIICITGFMQEDQDKADFWQNLVQYYKHAEVFAVSWNACTSTTFLSSASFDKDKGKKTINIMANAMNFVNTMKRQFIFAID